MKVDTSLADAAPNAASYAAEVQADSSGKWAGNALRFGTIDEAKSYVLDLYCRWTLVSACRVVPSDEAVHS